MQPKISHFSSPLLPQQQCPIPSCYLMVWNNLNWMIMAVVNSDRIRKLGLSNFNNKALKINTITIGLRWRMPEPVLNPKIAPHKSTMENPLLCREKNEVAGMG
ncbi:hypothetical protein ATANTOWER_005024 [Ataeniobius toweri]|uniref:Uncharacterized protein n=1 Tax=Ataeniobius toweri TaxID=208326 RepID=A0ABU7BQY5_9TELE|nr:hypothetical protein [Ataeniobius toweri]